MTLHERLLRLSLDSHRASALLGDLEEEAARIGAGDTWITRQALRCALSAAHLRTRTLRVQMLITIRLAFRDARRSLLRFPGTSLVAILILSLSMTAGAVTFAVVDTIVLRPLPYADSDRLVSVAPKSVKDGRSLVSPVDYYAWRDATSSFETLAAWRQWPFRLSDERGAESVTMVIATASLFDLLRVKPLIGTTFGHEHETPGHDHVAVISHGLWQRRYGANPDVIGQSLRTPTGPVTIIGVMPQEFAFPVDALASPAIWRPLAPKMEERVLTVAGGRVSYLQMIGRLKRDVSLEQARADVDRVYAAQAAAHPQLYAETEVRTDFLLDALTERVAGWMRLVLLAVAVLMAIGCVNVANLLLTRAAQRARDISVRLSLGATRVHVIVALVAESLVLSAIATTGGLVAAAWLLQIVKAALPAGIVRAGAIQLDPRVFAVCAIAGTVAALIAGLLPGWQASRVAPSEIIKERAGGIAGPTRRTWQNALLVAQVALVTMLIVAATLLVGSFARVVQVDLGFSMRNLVGVRLSPRFEPGAEKARVHDFYARVTEAAGAVPGVASVAMLAGGQLPLYRGSTTMRLTAPGSTAGILRADFRRVSQGYFETAGIRILEGRPFAAGDRNQPVVIIDELAARHFFNGASAVGQRVLVPGRPEATVIGVTANVRVLGPEGATEPQVYTTVTDDDTSRVLLVRTSQRAADVAPALEAALAALLPPTTAKPRVDIVEDQFRVLTADRRFNAAVMSALGLLAFFIAATGIYATTSSMVAQQRKDIGIRMALGASASRVVRAITTRTARLLLAGAVIGLVLAWAASGILASVVFGIRPTDALAYVVPLTIVAAGGCIAAFLPAMKAARIDPLVALRTE